MAFHVPTIIKKLFLWCCS